MSEPGANWTIARYSLQVLRQNRKLLVFPLFALAAGLAIYMFYVVPLSYHLSAADVWHAVWNPHDAVQAVTAAVKATTGDTRGVVHLSRLPSPGYTGLVGLFLLIAFQATFINCAFYSQIIHAMNGGRVSISGGFAQAAARLPAIVGWTLLGSAAGMILPAGMFVIPVMINEPRSRNPLAYLKISGSLLKRTWGKEVSTLGAGTRFALHTRGFWIGLGVMVLGDIIARGTNQLLFSLCGGLLGFVIIFLQVEFTHISLGGLYIYATEGVAPGNLDAAVFERAWIVRKRT